VRVVSGYERTNGHCSQDQLNTLHETSLGVTKEGFVPDDSGPDWSRVEQQLPEDYFRQPSPARVWNYWLGGKDNYEPDQKVGDVVADIYPGIRTMATQSRQFLIRTVRHLAEEAGIRQFLDLGAGLPDPSATTRTPSPSPWLRTRRSSTSTATRWCWPTRGH
jgi:hypothetical protein